MPSSDMRNSNINMRMTGNDVLVGKSNPSKVWIMNL